MQYCNSKEWRFLRSTSCLNHERIHIQNQLFVHYSKNVNWTQMYTFYYAFPFNIKCIFQIFIHTIVDLMNFLWNYICKMPLHVVILFRMDQVFRNNIVSIFVEILLRLNYFRRLMNLWWKYVLLLHIQPQIFNIECNPTHPEFGGNVSTTFYYKY